MLHVPRLELLLFMMVLPMVVAAGATLLRADGSGYVAAGVVFAVLLPAAFLGVSLAFIIRYLVRHSVEQRRAVFVLRMPPSVAAEAGGTQPPPSPFHTAAAAAQTHHDLLARDSGTLTQQFLTGSRSGLAMAPTDSLGLQPSASAATYTPSATGSAQFILAAQPSSDAAQQAAEVQREQARSRPAPGSPAAAEAAEPGRRRGPLRAAGAAWRGFQRYFMRPVFGFDFNANTSAAGATQQQSSAAAIPVAVAGDDGSALTGQGAWLCKSKWDTAFVKRYGSLFEDARGPQVYHITSVYEAAADDADGECAP